MSATTLPGETQGTSAGSHLGWGFGRFLRKFWRILVSPIRLLLSIRRSMTGASATLLVISIVTLNIIWGYPWVGMFSACLSLLVIGWGINRFTRPNLGFHVSTPRSVPAGQPVSVVMQARNLGKMPAMDLGIQFSASDSPGRKSRNSAARGHGSYAVLSDPHSLAILEPGQRVSFHGAIQYERRGIQALPDIVITSSFPFHLFRSFRREPSRSQIAITPRPMMGDEDEVARGMLDALGGWSHKLLSGDALDYTGSREYQVGMPVRRWDFTSWARLGRPIVREFQSPSIQQVALVVDTSREASWLNPSDHFDPQLERLLSLACTAVISLTQRMILVRLVVTSEKSDGKDANLGAMSPSDCESMLIRLAAAHSVSETVGDRRLAEAMEQIGRSPALILTTRNTVSVPQGLPPGVSLLRVDPPHHESGRSTSRSWRGAPSR